MSGTISLSLSQQFDSSGDPLDGGLLYFFQAGTTTPQSAYQDTALTIPHPNPIELDAAGRVPQFFLADGEIKIRLTSAEGVTQLAADNILVIGASSGSGGTSVDATKILDTGDLKVRYGTGVLSGFVRTNGRTIGSATSGASERANADCQDLFEYLWDADENLTVSTGRGANAAADWAANKTITLPDWRGRVIGGLDDMGTSAASRLTSTTMSPDGVTLGAVGGAQTVTVAQANLPNVQLTVSGTATSTASNIPINATSSATFGAGSNIGLSGNTVANIVSTMDGLTSSLNGSVGQTAVNKMPPAMLATIYLKL